MKTLALIFLVILFAPITVLGQNLSPTQAHQDFDFLISALEEGHPGLYWHNDKSVFEKTTKNVKIALEKVTNVRELHSLFISINNAISCGHTAILLPVADYQRIDSLNLFLPFKIALVEDKVLVSESFTKKLTRGDQLLSINGEPIDEIITELQRFIPVDKEIHTKRARSIEIVFPYYYAVYKGSPQIFTIEYQNREGKGLSTDIEATNLHNKVFRSVRDFAPSQTPLELSFTNSGRTAILKLATFSAQAFKKNEINFQDTIKGVFEYLGNNDINNLVIDLCWNNGGSMRFAEYLFSFFIDSTYRYYDDAQIRQSVMEGTTKYAKTRNMLPMMTKLFGELSPDEGFYHLSGAKNMVEPSIPRYNGDLYLLTNGLSFSATSAFITAIQQNNLGLVVGETPGGAFDGVNAGPPILVELPNSKLRLSYRMIGTHYNVDGNKTRASVDHEVPDTYSGFMEGRDEQLEYVLKLIEK